MSIPKWWTKRACAGLGPDLFFAPERSAKTRKAVAICEGCPVRAECLTYAEDLEQDINDLDYITGVYGGKTPKDRKERKGI